MILSKFREILEQVKPVSLIFLTRELLRCKNAGQVALVLAVAVDVWSANVREFVTPMVLSILRGLGVVSEQTVFQTDEKDSDKSPEPDTQTGSTTPASGLSAALKNKGEPLSAQLDKQNKVQVDAEKEEKQTPLALIVGEKKPEGTPSPHSDIWEKLTAMAVELANYTRNQIVAVVSMLLGAIITFGTIFQTKSVLSRVVTKITDWWKKRDFLAGGRDNTLVISDIVTELMDVKLFPAESDDLISMKTYGNVLSVSRTAKTNPKKYLLETTTRDYMAGIRGRLDATKPPPIGTPQRDSYNRISNMVTEYFEWETELMTGSVSRPKPVTVVLAGPPGVGKTHIVPELVARTLGVKSWDVWDSNKPNQDNCTGKSVLLFEEFGLVDAEADARALMGLADTRTYSPDCDQITKKELRLAPALIIVTTNRVNFYKDLACAPALSRRITFHLHATRKNLVDWKVKNPGLVPSADVEKVIFDAPLELTVLPCNATNWDGQCDDIEGTSCQSLTAPISLDHLVKCVNNKLARNRTDWESKTVFQDKTQDQIRLLFTGPPGTGKTTLACELENEFRVFDDPQYKIAEEFDAFVSAWIDDTHTVPMLATVNMEELIKRLADRGEEITMAFLRRSTKVDFGFRRTKLGLRHGPGAVKDKGWGNVVKTKWEGVNCSREYILECAKGMVVKDKTSSTADTGATGVVVARTKKNSQEFRDLSTFETFSMVSEALASKPELIKLASALLKIPRSPHNTGSLREMATGIQGAKVQTLLSEPVSIVFGNGSLTVGNLRGSDVLSAWYEDMNPDPVQTTVDDLRVELGSVELKGLEGISDAVHILLTAFSCASAALLPLPGEPDRQWTLVRQGPDVFQSIFTDGEDDWEYDPLTGRWVRRGRGSRPQPNAVNVARPTLNANRFEEGTWATNTAEVNYEEVIVFQNVHKSIYPLYDNDGDRRCWCFVGGNRVYFNRHAVKTVSKIGTAKVGPVKVSSVGKSDIAWFELPGGVKLRSTGTRISEVAVSDNIFLVREDGTRVPYTVASTRFVANPVGGYSSVYLLNGPKTEAGDCGLPYIRCVGTTEELVGVHSGMHNDQIMMSPFHIPPTFQVKGDRTGLYRTLLDEDLCAEKFAPSSKTTETENQTQLIQRLMLPNLTPPPVPRAFGTAQFAFTTDAVARYIVHLVGPVKPWGRRASMLSLDPTTSAGPAYNCAKSEIWDANGDLNPRYRKRFEGLYHTTDTSAGVIIKDELRPLAKIASGESRLIYYFNCNQIVKAKQYIGPIQTQLIKTVGSHPFAVGVSNADGSWDAMFRKLKTFEYGVAVDFKGWDKSCCHPLLDAAVDALLAPLGTDPVSNGSVELKQMIRADTPNGRLEAGLPSGVPGTSHLNCTVHLLMVEAALKEAGYDGYPEQDVMTFYCYGDDFIAGLNDKRVYEALMSVWKAWGFVATNDTKTGPPALTTVDQMSFLKRTTKQTKEGAYVGALNHSSIERALVWAHGRVPHRDGDDQSTIALGADDWINRLKCVMGEASLHGGQYYTELKTRIIGAFRKAKIPMPWYIPAYKGTLTTGALDGETADCIRTSDLTLVNFQIKPKMSDNQTNNTTTTVAGGDDLVVGDNTIVATPAAPTEGIATGQSTTGGVISIDPAVFLRWATTAGQNFTLNTTSRPGTILFTLRIHPDSNPFLANLFRMYNAWGGGLIAGMFMSHNAFVGGQIGVSFIPPYVDPRNLSLEELLSYDHTILDIMTMSGTEIVGADVKQVMWHQKGDPTPNGFGGNMVFYVANEIIYTATEATTLSVRVMTKPDANFAFAFLVPPRSVSGGGESNTQLLQALATTLATPSTLPRSAVQSRGMRVSSKPNSQVTFGLWDASMSLAGNDNRTNEKLESAKSTTVVARVLGPRYQGNRQYVVFQDVNGGSWEPTGTQGSSISLPPQYVQSINLGVEVNAVGAYDTTATPMVVGRTADGYYIDCAHLQPTNRILLLTIPATGDSQTPVVTPILGAESLVTYIPGASDDHFYDLQTIAFQSLVTKAPVGGNEAVIFNHSHNGVPTGGEFKLYPNGVLVTGSVAENLLYTGANTFTYQKLASLLYIPQGPATGAAMRESTLNLEKCVRLLALSSGQQSLVEQYLQGGSSVRRLLQPRTTACSNNASSSTTLDSLTGEMNNFCEPGSLPQWDTSREVLGEED